MTDPDTEFWERPEWDEEDIDLDAAKDHQRRRLMLLSTLGGLAVIAGLALTIWLLIAYNRASEADDRINRLENVDEERSSDLDRLIDAVDQLREQVENLGAVPVVPPAEDLVSDTGASDPDDPELQQSEAQEPEQQDPEINDPDPDDPDPDDQVTVSFSRLAAAFAAFCEANDGCKGPAGDTGADGAAGTTTCPAGFHFTQIRIPSQPDQTFLVCVQDQ